MLSRLERFLVGAFALTVLGTVSAPVSAQPVPTVNSPLVSVQRGQTLEVVVNGSNLAAVASTGMREPQGLEALLVKADKPDNARATVKLIAAPDATPSEREIRLVSPTGVS